jgi:hypothetical protein
VVRRSRLTGQNWLMKRPSAIFVGVVAVAFFSVVFYDLLLTPGGRMKFDLARKLRAGMPIESASAELIGSGYQCRQLGADPIKLSLVTRLTCYHLNAPSGDGTIDGIIVDLSAEDGRLANFTIKSCGQSYRVACKA